MSTLRRATIVLRVGGWIPAAAALSIAVVGFVAFVARPAFPPPVADVSAWVPDSVPGSDWDRLYVSHGLIAVIRPAVLLALVATGWGRGLLRRLTGWMSGTVVGAALAAVDVLVVVDLLTLPVAWWGRLSNSETTAWLADWLLTRAETWALVGLLAAGVTFAIRRWPRSWHWRAALVVAALAVAVPLAADLDPFADELRPLPESPARTAVEAGAARAGHSDVPLRVGNGPAASELGAYVSGIGPSRKIVVSGELIQRLPPQQIAFVAMHEFAHRENVDVYRKVLGTFTGLVAGFWILRVVLSSASVQRQIAQAKAPDARRAIIGLVVVAVVYTVAAPVSNLASRRSEAAADWRALQVTEDPASSIAIQRAILLGGGADPSPPAWYQAWLATHPTAAERIGLAVRYAELNGIQLTR